MLCQFDGISALKVSTEEINCFVSKETVITKHKIYKPHNY